MTLPFPIDTGYSVFGASGRCSIFPQSFRRPDFYLGNGMVPGRRFAREGFSELAESTDEKKGQSRESAALGETSLTRGG
jgi:hypothetical protein